MTTEPDIQIHIGPSGDHAVMYRDGDLFDTGDPARVYLAGLASLGAEIYKDSIPRIANGNFASSVESLETYRAELANIERLRAEAEERLRQAEKLERRLNEAKT